MDGEVMTASRPGARGPAEGGHFDVLIVGAGLSGICAAHHLQGKLPGKRYAILEGREAMGGTWDLFRYPGIRSDSDMHTLGYGFRPWLGEKIITDGPSIKAYIEDTARAYGIDRHIRFGHKVVAASWDSGSARWTVDAVIGGEARPVRFTCAFLFMCSGYYNYAEGHLPEWPGTERFQGRIVHPQFWPQDLDYTGKRVIIIGSGATAVTLVPAMADKAQHVTMLQRSPTYIVARPARDAGAAWLYKLLPAQAAHALSRLKNVGLTLWMFWLARSRPQKFREELIKLAREGLKPGFDVEKHLSPRYNPWDQRLCLIPDGDLWEALNSGKASIVTDTIEAFTETGLKLASGETLDADVVVTATGLKLQMLGGVRVTVDGRPVEFGQRFTYRGMMFSDVPNLALTLGYTNASWTLKAELTVRYVCRLLRHMDAKGYDYAVPVPLGALDAGQAALDLTSGYIQRARDILPKQASSLPWRHVQNYAIDRAMLEFGRIEDGVLRFHRARRQAQTAEVIPVRADAA